MISLYDGQITDLLPWKIAQSSEVRCISYAVQQEHQRMLRLAAHTRTMAVIDELPEKILDVLAVELRTPYYQESMNLETKRNIIKRTLLWHTKAGTPSAVKELVETVFGEGEIIEWFEYGGKPGTFNIKTNGQMTEDAVSYFLSLIQRVKNTRSHLRTVLIEKNIQGQEYIGSTLTGTVARNIGNQFKKTSNERVAVFIACGLSSFKTTIIAKGDKK